LDAPDDWVRVEIATALGVGRLEIVKSSFADGGGLKPPATPEQMQDGFAWACEFGRIRVVDFLLERGMQVDKVQAGRRDRLAMGRLRGTRGHRPAIARSRRPIDVKEERFGGTPLEWALHAWGAPERSDREPYYEVVALLVRAGAKLASGAGEEIQSEPRMIAALKGEF
jgi:hypothetical protein